MAQEIPDFTVIPGRAGSGGHSAERQEPAAPASVHLPGWRCITGAIFHAYGEAGTVDLVALSAERGVALIAFLAEGEEASPSEACEALRAMLGDAGFDRLFPGELPIIAFTLPRSGPERLAEAISEAFATTSAPTVGTGWEEWLAARLTPVEAPAPEPARARLAVPLRDREPAAGVALTAPPRAAASTAPPVGKSALAEPVEAPPRSASESRWRHWGMTLSLAAGVLLALLSGLALMVRAGRLP
jgi:hypothetical protein